MHMIRFLGGEGGLKNIGTLGEGLRFGVHGLFASVCTLVIAWYRDEK